MDIKNLASTLNESAEEEWDIDDLVEVISQPPGPPGDGGSSEDGREVENVEDPPDGGEGEGEEGDDDASGEGENKEGEEDSQDGEGEDGEEDDSKDGKGKGKDSKDAEDTEVDLGDSDINNGKEWMDDHSKIEESDSSSKGLLKKVYQETKAQYGSKRGGGEPGKNEGGFMKRIENYIKEDFDISKILRRLSSYKKKMSEEKKRNPTYQAAIYNPVTQQGNIMGKGSPKVGVQNEGSAVLFLAADTSGSITTEDYQSIFGYLNDIANKFKTKEHGIDGDVYLVEWDTKVHLPMRKWDAISAIKPIKDMTPEERKEFQLRGGGGTDIQDLFNTLDDKFTETDKDGNVYFTLSERGEAFKDSDGKFAKNLTDTKEVKVKLKEPKERKAISKAADTTAGKMVVKPGEMNFLEGKTTNAPFLIVYTDGWFSTPNIAKSKLFGASQGNILYVVTSKEGIKNIKPKNFLYHDLHGDDL